MAKYSVIDQRFWQDEERRLWDEFAPVALSLLMAGAKQGTEALPANVRQLVNYGVETYGIADKIIEYLNKYRTSWLNKIGRVTRDKTVKAIQEWIQSGERIDMLVKRIEPIYGDNRARRIAVTEVTRLYAAGNNAAWSEAGYVSKKRWNTVNDERVCPICGPLDGQEVDLDQGFVTIEGDVLEGPPSHVNCRCYTTPVVDTERVRSGVRGILEE